MFAKSIIDTDAFLEMPLSAQVLYFHLAMRADDEGFVAKPISIQRLVRASDDDMKLLAAKRYILVFDTGVIVIKHWKIHNYIRGDRLQTTNYTDEKSKLALQENGAYTEADGDKTIPIITKPLVNTECLSNVSQASDISQSSVSIGKDSIGKYRLGKDKSNSHFVPPTYEEVKAYCDERKNHVDANKFIDFYESKGWMIGKNKMKNWQAAVRTWEQKDKEKDNDFTDTEYNPATHNFFE